MCDSHCPTFWHVATLESLKTSGAPWFEKKNTAAAPPGRLQATLLASDAVWLIYPASEFRWILKESPFSKEPSSTNAFLPEIVNLAKRIWALKKTVINALGILHHLGCSQVLSNGESKWFCGNNQPADSLSKQIHLVHKQKCLQRISKICPDQEVEKKMTVSCYPFNSSGMGRWSLVASR